VWTVVVVERSSCFRWLSYWIFYCCSQGAGEGSIEGKVKIDLLMGMGNSIIRKNKWKTYQGKLGEEGPSLECIRGD
jgi:hypothetical protein